MSTITALSDPDKILHKKAFHRRNDSSELDVFEAARYFSGCNEAASGNYNNNGATFTQKMMIMKDHDHQRQPCRSSGARISLDVPMRNNINNTLPQQSYVLEKHTKEIKKFKQPSSPGGKLASFLNSLFNQTASKKKKSKSMKDHHEEESPGGRRRRRSSISHFRSSSITTDNSLSSKSVYCSSSSGFRTPPPYNAHTPTKTYKDLRSYSDHKQQVVSLPKSLQNGMVLDEKKFRYTEKHKIFGGRSEKNRIWVDQYAPEEKEFKKFMNEVDDGAESDSSSDLFELQNYDLDFYSSSGLPVYETTHLDNIKRGAPISNGNL